MLHCRNYIVSCKPYSYIKHPTKSKIPTFWSNTPIQFITKQRGDFKKKQPWFKAHLAYWRTPQFDLLPLEPNLSRSPSHSWRPPKASNGKNQRCDLREGSLANMLPILPRMQQACFPSYPECNRHASKEHNQKGKAHQAPSIQTSYHLVQFVHCWADGAEFLVRYAADREHPVKNTPVIDLQKSARCNIKQQLHTFKPSSQAPNHWGTAVGEMATLLRDKCGREAILWSDLDAEISQLQVTQDLIDDLQTLSVRNHGVVLPCDVKILGASENKPSAETQMLRRLKDKRVCGYYGGEPSQWVKCIAYCWQCLLKKNNYQRSTNTVLLNPVRPSDAWQGLVK